MRATEFLNELDLSSMVSPQQQGLEKEIKITIPLSINMGSGGQEGTVLPATDKVDNNGNKRVNTTIANPANLKDMPSSPVFISPLQQQLELQKQQGGKVSPVINQIIADTGPDADDDAGQFAQFGDDDEEPQSSIYYGIDAIRPEKD